MDGTSVMYAAPNLPNPGPSWHVKEAVDFNGDRKSDILWQSHNGAPAVWLMDGGSVRDIRSRAPQSGSAVAHRLSPRARRLETGTEYSAEVASIGVCR